MPAEPPTTAHRLAAAIAAAAADIQSGGSISGHADSLRRLVAEFAGAPGEAGALELIDALGPALRARGVSMPPLDRFPPSVAVFLEAVDDAFADDGPPDLDSVADRLERAAASAFGVRTVSEVRAQALREQIRREVSASIAETVRAYGLTPAAEMVEDSADELDDIHRAP